MTALIILMLSVYAASLVESIEAATVVFACGTSQGYRRPLLGAALAVLVLGVFIAAGGMPLLRWVPLRWLRLGTGALLLWVGQAWLRKAILRASGRKALHSEEKTYSESAEKLSTGASGFRLSFGAVLLEGSEIVLICGGLGIGSHHLAQAGIAALAAVLSVLIVCLVAARPLARAPENQVKLATAIGVLALGSFYLGEGAGLQWPGADAFIFALVVLFAGGAWLAIRCLRQLEVTP